MFTKRKSYLMFLLISVLTLFLGVGVLYYPQKPVVFAEGESVTDSEEPQYFDYTRILNLDECYNDEFLDIAVYNNYLSKYNSNKEVYVAVLDTGICTSHVFFKNRIATDSKGELRGRFVEGRECTVNLQEEYGSINPLFENYPHYEFEDDDGHGTQISSIICMLTPVNVKILPIKIANGIGANTTNIDALNGFDLVEQCILDGMPIVAVNYSYSGYRDTDEALEYDRNKLDAKIKNLRDKYGVLTTVCAGNVPEDAMYNTIASCPSAITISGLVGEKDENGAYTDEYSFYEDFSSYGDVVDFSAPAKDVSIVSMTLKTITDENGEEVQVPNYEDPNYNRAYGTGIGTSLSAAIAAASIANLAVDQNYYDANGNSIFAEDMGAFADEIESRLTQSAIDLCELGGVEDPTLVGEDIYYGKGALNFTNHQIPINHTVTDTVVTYDSQAHGLNIESGVEYDVYYSLTEGGPYNITDISNIDTFINVTNGAIPIYYKLTGKGDTTNTYFAETTGSAYLTINPQEVTIKPADATITYGDPVPAFNYEVVSGTIYNPADISEVIYNCTVENNYGAGDFTISIQNCNHSNNYIVTIDQETATLTINQKPINITLLPQQFEYGYNINLNNSKYTVNTEDIVNGDDLAIQLTTTAQKGDVVSEYDITVATNNSNYIVNYENGVLNIVKQNLVVSISNQESVYGTFNFDNTLYTVTTGEILAKDRVGSDFILTTTATISSGANDYPITLNCANSNYNVTATNGTYKITPKTIDITISEQTSEYGAEINLDQTAYSLNSAQIVNDDTIAVQLITDATSTSVVGSYTISASTTNANYVLSGSGVYRITKQILILDISNQEMEYGSVEEDFDCEYFLIIKGVVVEAGQVYLTTTANNRSVVGEYEITVVYPTHLYEVSYNNAFVNVIKRRITIAPNHMERVYGDTSAYNYSYNVDLNGIVNNDVITVTYYCEAEDYEYPVPNEYEIRITNAEHANYDIALETAHLIICPQEVEIKVLDQTFEYGEDIVLATDSASYQIVSSEFAIPAGDELNPVWYINDGYKKGIPVGVYNSVICLDACSNGKFNITAQNDGALIITKQEVEATLSNQTFTYGEINFDKTKYSVTKGNILPNDVNDFVLSTTAVTTSGVNSYPITLTCNNANYNLTVLNTANVIVEQRDIRVEVDNITITYGEAFSLDDATYQITLGNLVFGDSLNEQFSCEAALVEGIANAGTYDIVMTCSNNNYNPDIHFGVLTIDPIVLEIELEKQTAVYGDEVKLNNNAYTITSGELINGDSLNVELGFYDFVEPKNVDYYDIVVKSNNPNYFLNYDYGEYEITKMQLEVEIQNQEFIYGEYNNFDPTAYTVTKGRIVAGDEDDFELTPSCGLGYEGQPSTGNYQINLYIHSQNYDLIENNAYVIINKRPITIKADDKTIVFGEDIPEFTYSVISGSIINNDIVYPNYTCDAINNYSAGTFNIVISECSHSNYDVTIDSTPGILTINATPLEITLLPQQCEYGYDIVLNNDAYVIEGNNNSINNLNIVLSVNATKGSPVGNGYVISVASHNTNYALEINLGTFTITKQDLKVELLDQTFTYGEINFDKTKYNLTKGCILANDVNDFDLSTTAVTTSGFGSYPITLTCNNANYNLTVQNTANVIVNKRAISVLVDSKTSVYGNQHSLSDINYTVTQGEMVAGDSLNEHYSCVADKFSPVEDYDIVMTYSNANYDVTITNGKLTITPKDIEITIHIQSSQYGNQILINQNKYELNQTQIVNSDIIPITLSTNATSTSVVGNYDITATTTNQNYKLVFTPGIYQITKQVLVIEIPDQTFAYGSVNFDNTNFTVTQGKILAADRSKFMLTTQADNTSSVNNYSIALISDSANYNVTVSSYGKVYVNARKISVKVSDMQIIYGSAYSLENVTYLVTEGSIVVGDSLNESYSCEATANSPIGNYDIVMTYNNANYDVTITYGTLNIILNTITITLNKQTSVYGNNILIDHNAYQITEGELLPGDNLNIVLTTTATKTSNVGTYQITVVSNNNNYTVEYEPGEFEITPMEIKVNINNQQFQYGSVNFNSEDFEIVQGVVYGNDISYFELSTTATSQSQINSYPIALTCSNNNYTLTILNGGTVTIVPREITVEVGNITSVYGSQPNLTTLTYEVTEGSIVNGDNLNESYVCDATNISYVGEYEINMEYNNANYNVTVTKGKVIVTKKPITITLQNQNSTYGEQIVLNNNAYEITAGELVNNDSLDVQLATNATNTSNVGVYALSLASNNPNYAVTCEDGTYEITKKQLAIKINNLVVERGTEFNAQGVGYEIIAGEIVNNDNLNLSFTSDIKTDELGKYELTATYLNDNYEVTIEKGEVEVIRNKADRLLMILVVVVPALAVVIIIMPMFILKGKRRKL